VLFHAVMLAQKVKREEKKNQGSNMTELWIATSSAYYLDCKRILSFLCSFKALETFLKGNKQNKAHFH